MGSIAVEDKLRMFEIEVMGPRLKASLLELDRYYVSHKEQLAETLIHSWCTLLDQVNLLQEAEVKAELGFITMSMLRTELMAGQAHYFVEGMDSSWFLDPIPICSMYDAGWAFKGWFTLAAELEELIPSYQGAIIKPQLEQLMRTAAAFYHQYVVCLARYAMQQFRSTPQWAELKRHTPFEIRVGEYMDVSEVVWREDHRVKEALIVKADMEKCEDAAFSYEILTNLNLQGGGYANSDLRYSNLSGSDLSGSVLATSVLVGTNFHKCRMERANLCATLLYEADLSDCMLQGALFRYVEGGSGLPEASEWEHPSFEPVNFTRADLTGADFTNANLRGAVFVDAVLDDVNFSGADLTNAVFSLQAEQILHLDEHQHASIVWLPQEGR